MRENETGGSEGEEASRTKAGTVLDSEACDGDDLVMKIVEMRAMDASTSTKTASNESGSLRAEEGKEMDQTAGNGDNLVTKSVEMRASEASESAGLKKVQESEDCLLDTKSDELLDSEPKGSKADPLKVEETVESPPILRRQPDLLPQSTPGAFNVQPSHPDADQDNRNTTTTSLRDEVESRDANQGIGSGAPALDARLVDETVTAPRARVSRAGDALGNVQGSQLDEEQGLEPAVEVMKVPPEEAKTAKLLLWVGVVCIFLLLVIIVLMVLGLTGVVNDGNDTSSVRVPDLSGMTTLERIQATGQLRCGDVFLTNGFMYHDRRTGEKTGFYGELCHALAAALSVKAVFVRPTVEWGYLQQIADHDQNETADVAIIGHNINMERVVSGALEGIQEGLSFTTPMLYGGLKIGGKDFYITECVDKGMKHLGECSSIRVCISNMTTHYDTIRALMPTRFFVNRDSDGIKNFAGLRDGSCNVMVQGMFQLSRPNAKKQGVTNYSVSEAFYSKEPMAMVTKANDPEFSDFVMSVLQALLVAEQHNITQATADTFPETDLFGPQYKDMFQKAIAHAGNYGELYDRFLDEYIPRSSLNLLNNGSGLMYSLPWGRLDKVDRGDRPLGAVMQSILDRGVLHCGIRIGRPGFAERIGTSFSGMEIDLCKAIAAGLFQGDANAVNFVEISDSTDGFVQLASYDVDVVAGALWSIGNDVKEPTTGMGFAFSQPYFYGYSKEEDNFALATRQDDHDWASFVFWTITGLINAEENDIHAGSTEMPGHLLLPEHLLFGARLKRMFRDMVLILGNYGDIYEKHLEDLYPRSGRNMLNAVPDVGPQHYPLPGFFD